MWPKRKSSFVEKILFSILPSQKRYDRNQNVHIYSKMDLQLYFGVQSCWSYAAEFIFVRRAQCAFSTWTSFWMLILPTMTPTEASIFTKILSRILRIVYYFIIRKIWRLIRREFSNWIILFPCCAIETESGHCITDLWAGRRSRDAI